MEKDLKDYLRNKGIGYIEHFHKAVFTVEESIKIDKNFPDVLHTKNLFLKDESKNFFLVSMYAHNRLDLKSLREKIKAKKLSFASPEQLKERLNLNPGSVSIFGMIHAQNVTLIVDKKVWEAKKVGFHPNVNTATLEITHENLEKFLNSLNCKKLILEL